MTLMRKKGFYQWFTHQKSNQDGKNATVLGKKRTKLNIF